MQRGQVAEADEHLGIAADRGHVQPVDDALRAVSAAGAEHAANAGVPERGVEVGQPIRIRAGQIAELVVDVVAVFDE